MSLAEVLRLPEPEIKEFKPSEIDMKSAVQLGIDELIPQGYGYEGTGIKAGIRALSEYDEEDERATIYLAIQGGKALGSVITTRWTPEDEYGNKFWSDLKQRNRSLYKRLSKVSPLGLNISGITTHPDHRRRGLTEKMYSHIIKTANPSFITGITKTPEAVMARAKHLRQFGFRTFYGNTEVTPDRADFYTNVHQDLLDSDIRARWEKLEETLNGSDVYLIEGWLNNKIPDVSMLPVYMQKAFEQVIEQQEKANQKPEKKVAIKALISITPKVRLRAPESEDEPETSLEQIPLFESI